MKQVAEKLKELRVGMKFTQEKMGKIIGVNQSCINRYERDLTVAPIEILIRYADYFDISLDYLCGRTKNPHGKRFEYRTHIEESNPQMRRFVEMCFDPKSPMNERLKQTLLQMLEEVDE